MAIGFYAGLRRGKHKALLLGPYDTKAEADANVERAFDRAVEIDCTCHFDEPGVFRLENDKLPEGRLNRVFGIYNGA